MRYPGQAGGCEAGKMSWGTELWVSGQDRVGEIKSGRFSHQFARVETLGLNNLIGQFWSEHCTELAKCPRLKAKQRGS